MADLRLSPLVPVQTVFPSTKARVDLFGPMIDMSVTKQKPRLREYRSSFLRACEMRDARDSFVKDICPPENQVRIRAFLATTNE